ncbi:hypothetical protein JM83_3587 [Gillisia sp. Hel_I_86]|uniref:hypothetical protein n=1 Tax=Gillisia sp. Hel_I_86 TaxID=1249981 RepID=UPI001198E114|nr:hypothetical protein [Gillisia sp. Hel_I_86]TVZ28456.1 hypothetical protein JM83_3587 [Gillisia sp. Hel_I_86]
MKKVILFLFVLCGFATMQAQEVIQLDEARLSFSPEAITVDSDLGAIRCVVNESYTGEFSQNPIRFMTEKFDFKEFLSAIVNRDKFDRYLVTFNSTKGYLEAIYTNEGELVQTSQRFKDIVLPSSIRNQLFQENQGWTAIGTKYIASGKRDRIDKEIYKIKLENAGKKKTVKIVPSATLVGLVNN